MTSSYRKILQKITDTEKRLKPTKTEISEIMDYELNENISHKNTEDDIVEEYKNLKDNITGSFSGNMHLAYNPITLKNRKWSNQDL